MTLRREESRRVSVRVFLAAFSAATPATTIEDFGERCDGCGILCILCVRT